MLVGDPRPPAVGSLWPYLKDDKGNEEERDRADSREKRPFPFASTDQQGREHEEKTRPASDGQKKGREAVS